MLRIEWAAVLARRAIVTPEIPKDILEAIARSINSKIKTYRYVLPIQLKACRSFPCHPTIKFYRYGHRRWGDPIVLLSL